MAADNDSLTLPDLDQPGYSERSPAEHNEATDAFVSVRTTATYQEIASIYFEKWRDRSAIRQLLDRFVEMIRAYQLADLPVVDVGCGPGFDAAHFRRAGLRAVGIDLSPAMMAAGRDEYGGDFVRADMRQLPLARVIGGLWVSASLLHLPHEEVPDALSGFADLLVAGGLLYVSVKAGRGSEWTTESHGVPLPRYFAYWQPGELDDLLQSAGFHIVDSSLSDAGKGTSWLIRFARKASGLGLSLSVV